jgi:hypothetical protein
MKAYLARTLRRAATALNNAAERLEPSKERIQAAQEAAQAAIDRARRATVETVAEIRSEAQETAQRGQEYAATSPIKAKVYVALVFAWAFVEGMAWAVLFTFLFGTTAGFIASVIWSFCNIEACGRRGNALASYVFGLFTPRMEVNHA